MIYRSSIQYKTKMATIYKIWSEKGEKVYIGSTIASLEARFVRHQAPTSTCNSKLLFQEYGIDTCRIEAIEEVKEDEIVARERYWIEYYGDQVVNKMIPGRTSKEYYQAQREERVNYSKEYYYSNHEYVLEYWKTYREKNKDRINERKKEKIECSCGFTTDKNNFARHLKSKKHLSKVNS